jgi:hypothetical protein
MKYVVIKEPEGTLQPVFAAGILTHRELAAALIAARPGRTAASAGFVDFTADADGRRVVSTFGRSDSLELGPAPDDAALICCLVNATVQTGLTTVRRGDQTFCSTPAPS